MVEQQRTRADIRWTEAMAVVAGAVLLLLGLWAFISPSSFFDAIAVFEPYNAHFLRDAGAFQLGLGIVLIAAARLPDGLTAALLGVGAGTALHAVGHVLDRDMGGNPVLDIPALGVLAVALLVAGLSRWRAL